MIRYFQKTFALTEQGARDLLRASLWQVAANISLMLPVGVLVAALTGFVEALSAGAPFTAGLAAVLVSGVAILAVIFFIQWKLYDALYISTYTESANRRVRLGEKLRALPLSFFGKRDLSDLTATMMSDCSFLEQVFSHYVPQAIGAAVSTLMICVGLICMDWRMGLAAVWVIPVATAIVFVTRRLQMRFSEKSMLVKRAATDALQEMLETIKDIKACNQKERYLSGLREKLRLSERATIHCELVTGTSITAAQAFLKLGIATTALTGVTLLSGGEINFATLLVFLLAVTRLYDPVSSVFANLAATFSAQVRIERMRQIEEQPVQTGVSNYRPRGFDIVFQDVVLFRDTIMENIRLGRREATDEEVLAAARAAQCDEFVSRLPQGYNTVIGENGSTLSGGERQRISIARALLKDAEVILLDEATASLDVECETAVQAALSRLVRGKTVLVIAHRMRTVAGADKIVVLSGGHVAEQGTHEALMQKGGVYASLYALQQESSQWKI